MSFHASPNRIRVTDTDGRTAFDTDEAQFFATNFVSGTVIVGRINPETYGETVWALANVDPVANVVLGGFQVVFLEGPSAGQTAGVPGFGWFAAGGTYMHYMGKTMVGYTFSCAAGLFQLTRQWINEPYVDPISGLTITTQLNSMALNYRLWCGAFK